MFDVSFIFNHVLDYSRDVSSTYKSHQRKQLEFYTSLTQTTMERPKRKAAENNIHIFRRRNWTPLPASSLSSSRATSTDPGTEPSTRPPSDIEGTSGQPPFEPEDLEDSFSPSPHPPQKRNTRVTIEDVEDEDDNVMVQRDDSSVEATENDEEEIGMFTHHKSILYLFFCRAACKGLDIAYLCILFFDSSC